MTDLDKPEADAAELCIDARAELGEGPIWNDENQLLHWVDITGEKVHSYDPASGENRSFAIGQPVSAVVPHASGGLALAVRDGFASFDPDTGDLTLLADPEAHLPENRFNDGKCDPAGRFWAGTMAFSASEGAGSLYRLDDDLTCRKMLSGLTISNGIVWTADRATMYLVDSAPGSVTAYDYDVETGEISRGQVVIEVDEALGLPDGMAIDTDDKLWIAHYGGGCVRRWDPETGAVLERIDVPASLVTACAFGGTDRGVLYMTSASGELSDEQRPRESHAGGLFVADPNARGPKTHCFAG